MKKEETVTTISKQELPKSECRKIRGLYYKIGDIKVEDSGDCYKINDKFYKAHTGYIIYDHRKKEYVVKNLNIIVEKGVVALNGDTPIFGAFSLEENMPTDTILMYKGVKYACLNEDIFEDQIHFLEDLRTGEYVSRHSIDAKFFIEPVTVQNGVKNNLPYDSRGITDRQMEVYNNRYVPAYCDAVTKYASVLRDLTYGLEFETVKGFIPSRITDKLGLIPLRDGSVQGLEYVTIPLQGAKGMQSLLDSLKQLNKRTIYDDNCSMHIHIGNLPRTESFMVALMRVLFIIQDEMFDLFPIYKKGNYGVKRKHYTKPFNYLETVYHFDKKITPANLTENFDHLYRFLSMGQSYYDVGAKMDNVKHHPSDPRGMSKWNIRTRYHWVNLIPLLFGNKQTIEFRLHTPTYDPNKVMNYLMLCTSIINYVKDKETIILENPDTLTGLTLSNIVYDVNRKTDKTGTIAEELSNYMRRRRDAIYRQTKDGDIVGKEDELNFNYYVNWGKNNKAAAGRKGGRGLLDGVQPRGNARDLALAEAMRKLAGEPRIEFLDPFGQQVIMEKPVVEQEEPENQERGEEW